MKIALRIIAVVIWFWFYFMGKGFREAPVAYPFIGTALHLAAMLALYGVFFCWERTAVSAPDFSRNRRIVLACCWFSIGGLTLIGVISLASMGVFQPVLSSHPAFFAELLLLGVATLASATGLLYEARWAKIATTLLAFLISMSIPGLFVALGTWHAVRLKDLRAGGED